MLKQNIYWNEPEPLEDLINMRDTQENTQLVRDIVDLMEKSKVSNAAKLGILEIIKVSLILSAVEAEALDNE